MKLKYYLRGLSMGIIVTVIILAIANPKQEVSMSDEAVIEKAKQLGMVMDTESEVLETEIEETEIEETEATDTEKLETELTENESEQEQILETEEVLPPVEGQDAPDTVSQSEKPEIVEITITPGEYCRGVSEDLFSKGLVEDAEAFRKYMYEIKYDQLIRQGVYQIPKGASYEEIANILISDND